MNVVTIDAYKELLNFLNRLDAVKLPYSLRHSQSDSITVEIRIPGELWEVDFVDYGEEVQVEVEVFRGGVTGDEKTLQALFAKWAK